MPYVQYGGWCSCSIALEPRCSKFRGELTSLQAVCSLGVELLGVQPSPTWGSSAFIVQGGASCLHISIVVSWFRPRVLHLCQSSDPPGQSGVERLVSGWFWVTGCLAVVPSLVSRGGFATRSVTRRSSPILSVRTSSSVRSAAMRPSLRGFCLKDGTPVEECPAALRRCCPVTPTGVMEWCLGEAIIKAWEAELVDALSRCVVRPARPTLCPCQGVLWITQAWCAEGVGDV